MAGGGSETVQLTLKKTDGGGDTFIPLDSGAASSGADSAPDCPPCVSRDSSPLPAREPRSSTIERIVSR